MRNERRAQHTPSGASESQALGPLGHGARLATLQPQPPCGVSTGPMTGVTPFGGSPVTVPKVLLASDGAASLTEPPASRHSVLGMNEPADAQSFPSCSEIAGHAAGQTAPTELVAAQSRGPRTHDRCKRGSN